MNIFDLPTSPLPVLLRMSLVLLIDGARVRRVWTTRLLTAAHYQVYPVSTAREAFAWSIQYQTRPLAIVLGLVLYEDRFFLQRVVQRTASPRAQDIPVLSLTTYFPEQEPGVVSTSSLTAPGCLALLETLGQLEAKSGL